MNIEFKGNKPKYIEIIDYIKDKINKGELKADTKLPSKRNLALELNVSINTILNAYDQLLDEGYIYSINKKGYFITKQPIFTIPCESETQQIKASPTIKYDFTTRSVDDYYSFNFKRIMKNTMDSYDYLNKSDNLGVVELRKTIADHLRLNKGIVIDYKNIIIGSGLEMLERIIKVTEIDNLTLENPGYHKLKEIVSSSDIAINYQSLDSEGVLVPKNKTILYTTPFNQFPTGIKMTIKRKKELADFATQTKSYIIEDDFDQEFRINSNPTTSIMSLCPNNVIFFSTFSTTMFPGLRVAYTILPDELLNKYTTTFPQASCSVSTIIQYALHEYIKNGYYAISLNKRKKSYLEKRALCIELLNKYNIKYDAKRNYLSLLIELDVKNSKEFYNKCLENQILLLPLDNYYHENFSSKTFILGYTAISNDDIEEGIKLLHSLI